MAVSQPTLHELIPMERGTEVPDDELTTSGLARRHLMRGDAIEGKSWRAAYGGWKSIVTQQVGVLESLGYHFKRTQLPREPGEGGRARVEYRCTNTSHVPTEAQIDQAIDAKNTKRHTRKAPPKPKPTPPTTKALAEVEVAPPVHAEGNGNGVPDLPALPGLGQPLTVYAQVLNDDGSITLGMRNGTRRWTVNLTGVVEHS